MGLSRVYSSIWSQISTANLYFEGSDTSDAPHSLSGKISGVLCRRRFCASFTVRKLTVYFFFLCSQNLNTRFLSCPDFGVIIWYFDLIGDREATSIMSEVRFPFYIVYQTVKWIASLKKSLKLKYVNIHLIPFNKFYCFSYQAACYT